MHDLSRLTDRERGMLAMAAKGIPQARIAEEYGVHRHTVSTILGHAEEKLGIRTREELMAAWWEASVTDMLDVAYLKGFHDGLRIRGQEALREYRRRRVERLELLRELRAT